MVMVLLTGVTTTDVPSRAADVRRGAMRFAQRDRHHMPIIGAGQESQPSVKARAIQGGSSACRGEYCRVEGKTAEKRASAPASLCRTSAWQGRGGMPLIGLARAGRIAAHRSSANSRVVGIGCDAEHRQSSRALFAEPDGWVRVGVVSGGA
jgi:hypothetical protein